MCRSIGLARQYHGESQTNWEKIELGRGNQIQESLVWQLVPPPVMAKSERNVRPLGRCNYLTRRVQRANDCWLTAAVSRSRNGSQSYHDPSKD